MYLYCSTINIPGAEPQLYLSCNALYNQDLNFVPCPITFMARSFYGRTPSYVVVENMVVIIDPDEMLHDQSPQGSQLASPWQDTRSASNKTPVLHRSLHTLEHPGHPRSNPRHSQSYPKQHAHIHSKKGASSTHVPRCEHFPHHQMPPQPR